MSDTKRILVIIDMQKGFMNQHTQHLADRIRQYAFKNRNFFKYIITTKYINHEGTACYQFEKWYKCMHDTEEAGLVPEVEELSAINVEKDKYSCYNTDFQNLLKGLHLNEVYLCGVNTGCCVLHSAFDMYNDLISCYVIEDLCGSTSGPDSHKAAIKVLSECITKDRVIQSGL